LLKIPKTLKKRLLQVSPKEGIGGERSPQDMVKMGYFMDKSIELGY
jgi:hypothetical protein